MRSSQLAAKTGVNTRRYYERRGLLPEPTGLDSGYRFYDGLETILRRYGPDDPVLWDLARIVHGADLADNRYEALGLEVICRGLSMVAGDDETLVITGPLFDGLYEYRRRALLLGREPA